MGPVLCADVKSEGNVYFFENEKDLRRKCRFFENEKDLRRKYRLYTS